MPDRSPHEAPTWRPPEESEQLSGRLDAAEVNRLPDSAFAFPVLRKEPLTSASHVRDALARFDQVQGAGDTDRDLAFANIRQAASYFGVHVAEDSWRDLGRLAVSGADKPFNHQVRGWTVGQLRQALEGIPEDLPLRVMIAEEPDGKFVAEQVVISAGPWYGHGRGPGVPPDFFEIGSDFPFSQYRRS